MPAPAVCTSITHPIRIDWLDAPARVGMTLAPGVHDRSTGGFEWKRDLDVDLAAIRAAGATALVCLMEDPEFARYGIDELISRARAHDLEVIRLPIVDGGVPASPEAVDVLLDAMDAHESKGGRLVIHCRGGLGRTGTIAGCYLVRHGVSAEDTLVVLRRVRKSDRCPENGKQRDFIVRYAKRIGKGARPGTLAPQPTMAAKANPALTSTASPASASPWYASVLAELGAGGPIEQAATGRGSKTAVGPLLDAIEREVLAAPEKCFTFADDGRATLTAAGRTFAAGRFSTPTIGDLRARLAARPAVGGGSLVLSVLHGAHALTDIGTLQASAAPGTLFQVASQFNGLEAPGANIVPVRAYLHDNTQGPRAAVSAFPGTFLRHYRAPAPDGSRFVQTDKRCLNMLADVFDPTVAELHSGYLQTSQVRDADALAQALVDRFDQVRVGVHDDIEVVFGHDWGGPVPIGSGQRIAQVFTSTMALGGYSRDDGSTALATARRQLLRAAYLGTLLAAVELEKHMVVLTMIGGGAFGNPLRDIWDAIHWALAEAEPFVSGTMTVIVNTREHVADVDREKVRARRGVVVEFGGPEIVVAYGRGGVTGSRLS